MAKSQVKINVNKRTAAWLYGILLFIAFCLLYTLFDGRYNDTIVAIVKWAYILIFLPLSLYGIITLFSKRFVYREVYAGTSRWPEIIMSEEEIICKNPSGTDRVRWQDIVKIQVLTTDEGPAVCDVFFVLLDANDRGVVIPQDKQAEFNSVLEKVTAYPGFDHALFIESMGHTQVKWFTIWEKK